MDGLVAEKIEVMKNLSMEDVYGSHQPSSTISRFTSIAKENILQVSTGQEKCLYLAEVLGDPLETLTSSEGT